MSKNIETISELYTEFGRGDIPAVLDKLADDVKWEVCGIETEGQKMGVPWLQPRHDRSGASEFFDIVTKFDFQEFQVRSLMEGGNQVAAELRIAAEVPGGGFFDTEEMHLWTFNDEGKIIGYRHYMDNAPHIAAASGERGTGAAA